ncbi:MAG: YicC/YloC family endoribonuclease, partial [Terrimicrobiaceae bacterium]
MKSMTGHGRGTATANGLRVVVECFSVNRRQGEVALAASRELAWIEPRVREEVLKRISRGKVQVSVSTEASSRSAPALIDRRRASEFLREAKSLQRELKLSGVISLETVLAAPGVLHAED